MSPARLQQLSVDSRGSRPAPPPTVTSERSGPWPRPRRRRRVQDRQDTDAECPNVAPRRAISQTPPSPCEQDREAVKRFANGVVRLRFVRDRQCSIGCVFVSRTRLVPRLFTFSAPENSGRTRHQAQAARPGTHPPQAGGLSPPTRRKCIQYGRFMTGCPACTHEGPWPRV